MCRMDLKKVEPSTVIRDMPTIFIPPCAEWNCKKWNRVPSFLIPNSPQTAWHLGRAEQAMWSALRALGFLGSEGEEEEERDDVLLPSVRVAIVGAGVGGCSAAYFMRERGGEAVEVDVFEKGKVGGRTATHVFCDHTYETGASIIHATNRYMVDFSKEFG